jgi:hypothetical protein
VLVSVRDAAQMAAFMRYVNSNVAKEACILVDWKDKVWARRYKHSVLSEEEEILAERFAYILGQGLKENLVASPLEWPGASAAQALLAGKQRITGEWVDRTSLYKALKKKRLVTESDFTTRETLTLSPLPGWDERPFEEYCDWVRELTSSLVDANAARHVHDGTRPMGSSAVLEVDPLTVPPTRALSPAPLFLTATKEARQRLREAYRLVVLAYRHAAEQLRHGLWPVEFPAGCFPPPMPMRKEARAPS